MGAWEGPGRNFSSAVGHGSPRRPSEGEGCLPKGNRDAVATKTKLRHWAPGKTWCPLSNPVHGHHGNAHISRQSKEAHGRSESGSGLPVLRARLLPPAAPSVGVQGTGRASPRAQHGSQLPCPAQPLPSKSSLLPPDSGVSASAPFDPPRPWPPRAGTSSWRSPPCKPPRGGENGEFYRN